MQGAKKKVRSVSYAKWGYVFIAPFFIVFALFQLYPLVSTIYYSFFEYFFKQGGLIQVGPKFVGWTNYLYVFSKDLPRYFGNTIIMWLMGFIPQIVFSLLLAAWFTDNRLKLKCQGFFNDTLPCLYSLILSYDNSIQSVYRFRQNNISQRFYLAHHPAYATPIPG